ncbi:MAG: hypothetical protein JNJ54_20945 [Myxococcaceae bacterium]|nr:hypothetical protein [Myxococcaceae bacterium]
MRWLVAVVLLQGCFGTPVEQAPECRSFAACIRALDAVSGQTTNLTRFDERGFCWNNDTLGQACRTACTRALTRLRERTPSLPAECMP